MAKRKAILSNQPLRQSQRARVLNTRFGTPPKIVKDMLKDNHPSNSGTKRQHSEEMENLGTGRSTSDRIVSKRQNLQLLKNSSPEVSETKPRRQQIPSRRYISPSGLVSKAKSTKSNPYEITSVEKRINSRKQRNASNGGLDDVSTGGIRHSTRQRIPNLRFGYIIPGFLQPEREKRDNNTKRTDENKKGREPYTISTVPKKRKAFTIASPKSTPKKSVSSELRHSQRQRIPNKRLSSPAPYILMQAHKKSKKGSSGDEKIDAKAGTFKKSERQESISATKHIQNSSSKIIYPYKSKKARTSAVHSSSFKGKDYTSRHDVDHLIMEINDALGEGHGSSGVYIELRQKVAHHLNNLRRENCRLRKTVQQLRNELNTLRKNSPIKRYSLLMKRNNELREQKVLADIRYEAQAELVQKLTREIGILESENKDLKQIRTSLFSNRREVRGRQFPDGEMGNLQDVQLNNFSRERSSNGSEQAYFEHPYLQQSESDNAKDDHENSKLIWGNDSWMLHC